MPHGDHGTARGITGPRGRSGKCPAGGYRSASGYRTGAGPDSRWLDLLDEVLARVAGRLLVVLDTVEQAQRRGPSAMYAVSELVQQLVAHPEVLVVLSGRARMPELLHLADEVELVGLAGPDAIWLTVDMAEGAVDHPRAAALVDRFGTSPLTVRLVAALLAKTQAGTTRCSGCARRTSSSTPSSTCGSSATSRTRPSEPLPIPDSSCAG